MAFVEYDPTWKFAETEIGDCVKVIAKDGNEFRGVVSQVSGNIIWIQGGDIYWRDTGDRVGSASNDDGQRIEHATLDELDPLLDVSFLE